MSGPGGALVPRMMGAATLDIDTYEKVEHDEGATGQAATVVILVAIAQAIGGADQGLVAAAVAGVSALVGWGIWAGVTYGIGTAVFNGTATWGELLRTLGFAQAPGILAIIGIIPLMGLVTWIIPLWLLVTGFVAVRQALDIGNGPTFLTILIGWVIYVGIAFSLAIVTGVTSAIF